jgi:hypothetical protein
MEFLFDTFVSIINACREFKQYDNDRLDAIFHRIILMMIREHIASRINNSKLSISDPSHYVLIKRDGYTGVIFDIFFEFASRMFDGNIIPQFIATNIADEFEFDD